MKEEILGLSVLEELQIKCGDCGSPLANLVVSESNESRLSRHLRSLSSQYKITNCYKCGGSSFLTKIVEGSASICAAKDSFDLDETDTNVYNNVIISTLKVLKR